MDMISPTEMKPIPSPRKSKYRCIYMHFTKELDERQQKILTVNLQAVRDGVAEKLKKMGARVKRLGSVPILGGAYKDGADMLAARFRTLESMISFFMRLDQIDSTTYRFAYVYDEVALANITIAGRKLRLGEFLEEKKLIEALEKHVFPDMQVEKPEIHTELEELAMED